MLSSFKSGFCPQIIETQYIADDFVISKIREREGGINQSAMSLPQKRKQCDYHSDIL
jgi:hypothetical protein